MSSKKVENNKKWYERLPHPYVMLFLIIVFVTILTYIVPAGAFFKMIESTGALESGIIIALALGYDLMVGAGMTIGAVGANYWCGPGNFCCT
ncbi:MAG: hypothetical protein ACOC21_03610 [Halanaerobiales bacterium]